MKNNFISIVNTFIFLIIGMFLFFHITYVFRPLTHENQNFKGFYAEPKNSLDVVFIGSSGVRAAVDPVIIYDDIGITSYIVATSNLNPRAIPYLITEAHKTQQAAMYIIEISSAKHSQEEWIEINQKSNGSVRNITDGMKFSVNYFNCIRNVFYIKDKLTYYFDLLYYHDNWSKELLVNALKDNSLWNYKKETSNKGHIMWESARKQVPIEYGENETDSMYTWDLSVLSEIIEFCDNHSINAIYYVPSNNTMNSKDFAILDDFFREKNKTFWFMNEYKQYTNLNYEEDFYDSSHLSVSGAVKETHVLANLLENENITENAAIVNDSWNNILRVHNEELDSSLNNLRNYIDNRIDYSLGAEICDNYLKFYISVNNDFSTEYAWYVEHADNSGDLKRDRVDWYTDEKEHSFDLSELEVGISYQIRFFIRNKEGEEGAESKIVAYLNWDEDNQKYKLISNFDE